MTSDLSVSALLVVGQVMLEMCVTKALLQSNTWMGAAGLYAVCREVRFAPCLQCFLGRKAMKILANRVGWWLSFGWRVSFDVILHRAIPPRGEVATVEEAWLEMAGFLEPRVLAVLFWDDMLSTWWRFAGQHVGEHEILGHFRLPGGHGGSVLFRRAWSSEEETPAAPPQEEDMEEETPEDDPIVDDDDDVDDLLEGLEHLQMVVGEIDAEEEHLEVD